jgi:hypothetical protein
MTHRGSYDAYPWVGSALEDDELEHRERADERPCHERSGASAGADQ